MEEDAPRIVEACDRDEICLRQCSSRTIDPIEASGCNDLVNA